MSLETATDGRLLFARRWEDLARWSIYLAVAGVLIAGLMQNIWIALVSIVLGLVPAWIFNLRCPECAWLVYRHYGTAKAKYAKDQFLAPQHSKQLWKQPVACSKCGHSFRADNNPIKVDS